MKLLSDSNFVILGTMLVAGMSSSWAVVDTLRLYRALREDRSDPDVRDRIFGSIIGLMVASLGIFAAFHYHLA